MDDWVLWLILAVVFAVGEIATLGFFLAPFAGGGRRGGGGQRGRRAARRLARRLPRSSPAAARRAAAPGALAPQDAAADPHRHRGAGRRDATVVERIANHEGAGCVRIDGEVWTARSYIDDEIYEAGTRVQVVEIRGATALVTD